MAYPPLQEWWKDCRERSVGGGGPGCRLREAWREGWGKRWEYGTTPLSKDLPRQSGRGDEGRSGSAGKGGTADIRCGGGVGGDELVYWGREGGIGNMSGHISAGVNLRAGGGRGHNAREDCCLKLAVTAQQWWGRD